MRKFSLRRLVTCAKYEKLTSEDYLRLRLCLPDTCPDCSGGQGHYVKNDNMIKNNLLLNNQIPEDKLHQPPQPLKKIVNNLANEKDAMCNQCKVEGDSKDNQANNQKGFVNLAFVDSKTESAPWFQPHMSRETAVKIVADCPVGSFIIRNSKSHLSSGYLAMTVRVPKSFNDSGILHYLIVTTEAGFRIKGFTKVFHSLNGLIVHHSVMKENLPCRLFIDDDDVGSESDRDSDFADMDSDPEYPDLIVKLAEQLSR